MTNALFIDLDTEREKPIVFGKPPDITPPSNKDEARLMILSDIATVTDALKTLILMAHENEYADKIELTNLSIASINEIITLNESKENTEGSNS